MAEYRFLVLYPYIVLAVIYGRRYATMVVI